MVGCTGTPEGIEPVKGFEKDKYLGKWYEIARLDHSFERGLDSVTAEYSLRPDGSIKVINRGRFSDTGLYDVAEGRAYFVGGEDTGHLKVSFFGPFYGSYVIFGLDKEDYQYAFVTSYNKSYLWLLSRTKEVDESLLNSFLSKAKELDYNIEELIFVDHVD
jgi:apolipoprotein D and lipocalin family protein